jgi:ZIP family zinc transporter
LLISAKQLDHAYRHEPDADVSYGENAGGGKSALGLSLLVGPAMNNIPENIALGISLVTGRAVNVVLIAAIFISNFPEGLLSTEGMKSRDYKYYIIFILLLGKMLVYERNSRQPTG